MMAGSLVVTMFGGIKLAQSSVSDEAKPASSPEESDSGSGARTDNSEKRRIELLFGNQDSNTATAYGTNSVEFNTDNFDTLDEAKAYVRENYLLGLASQFNVFVKDDIVMHAADIEGRAAVGGVEQTVNNTTNYPDGHPNEVKEIKDVQKNIPDADGNGNGVTDNVLAFDAGPIGYYYEIGTGHKINIIEYSHGECKMVPARIGGKALDYTSGDEKDSSGLSENISDKEQLFVPAYITGESTATAKKDINLTELWNYV